MDVKSIKNYFDEVNWTIVGVILALFFGLFTVYVNYAEYPNITFDVVNDANVLDVHKPLNGLDIYFQGDDIQQSNLNLRIISVKIENTGNVDILQNFYDRTDIFGLKINDGQIIESRLIDSNSEYLTSNLNLKTVNNTVELSKPIFEKNKYFIVEILILHDKNEEPTIVPLGKIAGIDGIELRNSYADKQTFFDTVFYGSLGVHLTRFLTYLIIFTVSLSIIVFTTIQIDTLGDNRRLHKRTLLVDKLEFFDNCTSQGNKSLVKTILLCIQQDEWWKTLHTLKTFTFDVDYLKHRVRGNVSDVPDFIHYIDYTQPAYNINKIGSYLYKHELLEEISGQCDAESNEKPKYKINELFLTDLESSISFLQNI